MNLMARKTIRALRKIAPASDGIRANRSIEYEAGNHLINRRACEIQGHRRQVSRYFASTSSSQPPKNALSISA